MALPINIEDLLNKRKVESNRIEFKASWNPDKIYHTICAFATDLENTGGGYILVGVEEENGTAKRPVKGISETEIDGILKDMVGYDAKISPSYLCKVSPEDIDGRTILVIWVPTGINRPYSVMESVVAKNRYPNSISGANHRLLKRRVRFWTKCVSSPIVYRSMREAIRA